MEVAPGKERCDWEQAKEAFVGNLEVRSQKSRTHADAAAPKAESRSLTAARYQPSQQAAPVAISHRELHPAIKVKRTLTPLLPKS
jgi:hypothetical protein